MSVMSVEEWRKSNYDRIVEEYAYKITVAVNDELKRKTNPPLTVTIMLGRTLNQYERTYLDIKIRRVLRGSGWNPISIQYNEDVCRISFDVDSNEAANEAMLTN